MDIKANRVEATRPRHRSTRPVDEPVSTNVTGMDFEKRRLYIAPKSIIGYMLSIPGYGMEYGSYGRSRYGRCLYGARVGIYGSDRYGSCVYY